VCVFCVCVDQTYSPVELISAIQGYVEHFLGCRECAENFGRGASQLLGGGQSGRFLRQRDGAVMWLWTAHNRANLHLRGDITEDPFFPKVQFPLSSSCPACHEGRSWNETAVLQYLVNYYGAANIVDDDIDNGAGMRYSCNCHAAWSLLGAVILLQLLLVACI